MEIVNFQRNATAAHSGALELTGRTSSESRAEMLKDLENIGNEFIHMLNHIADLESKIFANLERFIRAAN
jgi:argininosuccinate lyase